MRRAGEGVSLSSRVDNFSRSRCSRTMSRTRESLYLNRVSVAVDLLLSRTSCVARSPRDIAHGPGSQLRHPSCRHPTTKLVATTDSYVSGPTLDNQLSSLLTFSSCHPQRQAPLFSRTSFFPV